MGPPVLSHDVSRAGRQEQERIIGPATGGDAQLGEVGRERREQAHGAGVKVISRQL